MRSWSISVGRLLGVDLRIHLTFLVLPIFIYWTDYATRKQNANEGRDLALVGIILACVCAHEFGHLIAERRFGLIPKAIILLPLTGVSLYDESRVEQPATLVRERELRIAMVGPLVNLALAGIAVAVISATNSRIELWKWPFFSPANIPSSIVWGNLYLAGLNLLPAYPLDGGRLVRMYFARTMEPSAATRRAVAISSAISMVLIFGGLFTDPWLTMVGVIVFSAAQLEERALVFRSVLDNVRLEEVMLTDFATLSPADTLEDALEKAVHSLQDDFPVVRGSDMVGVISRQKILEALRAEGNGYVQAVMSKIFEVSLREDSLGSAFRKLTARSSSIIPVVEDQRLVGIVTLQNLMHSMSLLAESRKLRREDSEA